MAMIFCEAKPDGILRTASLKNALNLPVFLLSKNSSFSRTVPTSSEITSVILPPLMRAHSVEPPPISIVTHSSNGARRFFAAIAP